jgi:hypothetical protein
MNAVVVMTMSSAEPAIDSIFWNGIEFTPKDIDNGVEKIVYYPDGTIGIEDEW